MVRVMNLKSALEGLCYDAQRKLNENSPELVMAWMKIRLDKIAVEDALSKKFNSKTYREECKARKLENEENKPKKRKSSKKEYSGEEF